MSQLVSSVVVSAVGLTCKAFLSSGLCSITVNNLQILLDALSGARRHSGQGLVTVSNHLSTLDDPVTWGILPFEHFTNPRTIRWVLGASDIMFTNPLFSAFFRKGQVIETFRGNGIWQPALDEAIEKLNEGHWLHTFGEGKWGIGRIIMETNVPPLIIPIWLTGFDKLMPEHRPFPYKFFPKIGVQLSVTFGDPISHDKIMNALNVSRKQISPPSVAPRLGSNLHSGGWMERAIAQAGGGVLVEPEAAGRLTQMDKIRSGVTAVIQQSVEDLGRKISGNKLDLPPSH